MHDDLAKLQDFASRYTASWCSQNAASVAALYAPGGSLAINGGSPSIGREAIAETARSFMTAFPDLRVTMGRLVHVRDRVEYHWTLTGTNTGPGGTGRFVHISGFESWLFAPDGLILESQGHFDATDYQRQLTGISS
jgi:hypothetical protein